MSRLVFRFAGALVMVISLSVYAQSKPIPIENFVKFPEFTSVKISPTGKYLAVAMPSGDQTGLQIIDISDPQAGFKPMAAYRFSNLEHVFRIYWASNERVVFETTRETDLVGDIVPRLTGRIYAINADGSDKMVIQGSRRGFTGEYGFVIDPLKDDPDHVLVYRKHYGDTEAEVVRLNIHGEGGEVVATSPFSSPYVGADGLIIDNQSNVRVAFIRNGLDESMQFAHRENNSVEWKIRKLKKSDSFLPVGFLPDDRTLVVEKFGHPMGYFALDPVTLEQRPLLTHDVVEARSPITALNGRGVIGAVFENGRLENRFIKGDHPDARLYKLLEQAFEGLHVEITSVTRNGKLAIVAVSADRLPTDYYLFNTKTNKADFLLASMQWLDPALLAQRQPVSFKARDGLTLHGYLTLPVDKAPKDLPLVTIVHGGPHGVRDSWLYDYEAQMLANRGYAVLQTNYRGSGGYGAAYGEMGWLNWGRKIQDDIEDGVMWAVEQGIADKERMCIYGASFGGYSVLSQLVRNPDLFKCGFAFVGVYDLELMFDVGDVQFREDGEAYLERVLGTDKAVLRDQSPIHDVSRIKAGLYVAHGREDERAHINHYLGLLDALDEAGIPYEKMLKHEEGHGFYDMDNRVELYTEMVGFIDAHIGAN